MDQTFKLDDKEHERKCKEIEADLFEETTSVSKPRVFITGGQPGSGKSKVLEKSRQEFPDRNVVVINGDELRGYHPKSDEILKLDDRRYAERTDPDCRLWTKRVFDRAIETRRNIAFESTMRDPGRISKTMQRLRDEGYHLTARVVATNERLSITGIFRRYEEQKAVKGYGRFSELSSHDAGYAGMPKTVEHIEQNKLVDRLEVYNRDGELLLSKELLSDREWDKPDSAVKAIERERSRPLTKKEKEYLRDAWKEIHLRMQERQAPMREVEEARKVHSQRVLHSREKTLERESLKDSAKRGAEPGQQNMLPQ